MTRIPISVFEASNEFVSVLCVRVTGDQGCFGTRPCRDVEWLLGEI